MLQVEYVTLPGWARSIEDVRTLDKLPEEASGYVRFIEEYLQIPGK